MWSDDQLYRRFRDGEVSAYDELMVRLGDGLVFYLNGYLHHWQDAEDLMIEAFARIMVRKPLIAEGKFKAYLYRTARNLAANYFERVRRRTAFLLDETEPVDGRQVEELLQEDERKRTLHLCLERIDPDLQEVLWLVYFEEMTYAQAGMVMGMSTRKIDRLLANGKKKLRTELEKEGITNAYE